MRRTPPALELIQVREGSHPGFLRRIFRGRILTDDGTHEPIETLVVAAHQELEQLHVAAANALDDLGVRPPRTRRAW